MIRTLLTIKIYRICTIVAMILSSNIYSQGTTCAGATSVTVDGACAGAATINDATIDGNANVCGAVVSREGWYKFTATAANITIVADASTRNVAIELLATCAGAAVAC